MPRRLRKPWHNKTLKTSFRIENLGVTARFSMFETLAWKVCLPLNRLPLTTPKSYRFGKKSLKTIENHSHKTTLKMVLNHFTKDFRRHQKPFKSTVKTTLNPLFPTVFNKTLGFTKTQKNKNTKKNDKILKDMPRNHPKSFLRRNGRCNFLEHPSYQALEAERALGSW